MNPPEEKGYYSLPNDKRQHDIDIAQRWRRENNCAPLPDEEAVALFFNEQWYWVQEKGSDIDTPTPD